MIIQGKQGLLRVGYQHAAVLRDWYLAAENHEIGIITSTITARLITYNKVWINEKPMVMELCLGMSWWVWEDVKIVNLDELKEFGQIEMYTKSQPIVKHN